MFRFKVESGLDSVIGGGTEIQGDLTVRGSLRLDGRVDGNVSVMEGIFLGPNSYIKGDVHCCDAMISGKIEGNVIAQGLVELQAGASVVGDITCRNLVLDRSAFLEGRVKMTETAPGSG